MCVFEEITSVEDAGPRCAALDVEDATMRAFVISQILPPHLHSHQVTHYRHGRQVTHRKHQ